MAFTIPAPKNRLLLPFFVLLVVVLAPFALLFSLLRLPFAKSRTKILNESITEDWLPRKKFIYLNYDEDFPLAEFVDRELITKYGSYIIFDRWSEVDSEWNSSEPDTYRRITTVQQDIIGDFDGEAHLTVAILSPEAPDIKSGGKNVLSFVLDKDNHLSREGKPIAIDAAKAQIVKEINSSIRKWEPTLRQ